VLALVPTRELAQQVHSTAGSLRRVCGLSSASLFGGGPREEQVAALLEQAVALLVSTTGRLLDLLASKSVTLSSVTLLVLDEADTMIAHGFAPQVSDIVGQMRPDRQTLLFSATFSDTLEEAAAGWLSSPVRIIAQQPAAANRDAPGDGAGAGRATIAENVAAPAAMPCNDDESGVSLPPASVEQRFVRCEGGRRPALLRVLQDIGAVRRGRGAALADLAAPGTGSARQKPRVLVFINTIKSMHAISQFLKRSGADSATLHGQLSQLEREEALSALKSGKKAVLLCTDVAGRGVHIAKLGAVIHFDLPATLRDYVHRTGRTGRQGAAGLSVALLPPSAESRAFARLVSTLLKRSALPLPEEVASLLEDSGSCANKGGEVAARGPSPPAAEATQPQRKRVKHLPAARARAKAAGASLEGLQGQAAFPTGVSDLLEFAQTCATVHE